MLDHAKETTFEVDGMHIDVEHNTDLRTVVADICTDIDHAVVLGRNRSLSRIITTVE